MLKVKKLSENAHLPTKGSPDAAGFDLYSAVDIVIKASDINNTGGFHLVPTDISIAIPKGTYGRVAPRSGLTFKNHIDVGAGVIDYDYRGPVGVLLINHGFFDVPIKKGDRIAQLILEKICDDAVVTQVDDLDATEREGGGFGSTGI